MNDFRCSQFESLAWARDNLPEPGTPAITPGHLSGVKSINEDGSLSLQGITFGVHWNAASYPAWTGEELPRDARVDESYAPLGAHLSSDGDTKVMAYLPPFGITHIAQMVDQIRDVFGFQQDVAVNVFELLMSQLDSRSSRSNPRNALHSLHRDYISGPQANYRKWYFAAEMDVVDEQKKTVPVKWKPKDDLGFFFDDSPRDFSPVESVQEEERTLEGAEAIWDYRYQFCSDKERLVEVLIYLFCWTEANQIRFMPECLAFVVKCCFDYYNANFQSYPQHSRTVENLPKGFFLDKIITPIYQVYCSYNFTTTDANRLIRREGDHKNFIGYDDMNQLFWYKLGIERVKIRNPAFEENYNVLDNCQMLTLISLPAHEWLLALQSVDWKPVFAKTYRESRSWLHSITNFSRIWIIHASMFWFYTAYHTPSLYSPNSSYSNPIPPKEFVKWTIMSFGGVFGPLITLIGLIGELRFVPRSFAGARPLLPRFGIVTVMLLILLVPAICNLVFNPWTSDNIDLMPATVISGVLFSLAILYSVYLSFQPLDSVHGYCNNDALAEEFPKNQRRFLANYIFTGSFPKRTFKDSTLSWLMCLAVFAAKFTESYFFLTLSVRDPLYELGIMDLSDKCVGDKALFGRYLCTSYPLILLAIVIITDMILFFLDTYLWYVILNTVISVSISFKRGTSVWTPWRNIYSRLATRINTKLLAGTARKQCTTKQGVFALRIVWNSIIESMYKNHVLSREQAGRLTHINDTTREPAFFTMEEDGNVLESTRSTSNAYRRISFFAQSLSTPMPPAVPVSEMPAFTVIIPHYKETMILGLSESINADMGAKVTILEYLQRLYPSEWENFVQETCNQGYSEDLSTSSTLSVTPMSSASVASTMKSEKGRALALKKLGFSTMDPNDTMRTRMWCSERTQTLYRTLKGFSNYTAALRVFYLTEEFTNETAYEFADFTSNPKIEQLILNMCARKFRLLVAMQLYSQFTSEQLQEVETILNMVPELVISYVDHDEKSGQYYTCMFDASCPLLESGRRAPRLKIRLSGNPILGDGKADNQNTALPFYRGEYIQLVDANQDNYIEECLKIRNVLMEFETPATVQPNFSSSSCDLETGMEIFTPRSVLSPGPAPVAIVGAREYIFSENIGILGDVAAGKEQTFGTLFSRTLAKIGAKLHYGHPDFLNAIFMTTRGGVSKAQKGLHLNEDIYAGMTAMLRGGRIKHSEYFQCGKGRDLGFVSILNFTAKIGAGMGEQILSREYFYMGTQLPFDRFIAFYYAHPGFHLNNAFITLSLEMLLIVILWISSIAAVNTACYPTTALGDPRKPSGCVNITPLLDWIKRCVISIFLVFFVSLCPLFFQEFTERGIIRSIFRIFRHFCSLSMLFEVFVCRIYARSFWEDMNIGGAKYLATGRGFAISRISFYKLYESYSPEIIAGLKAGLILLFASIVAWSPGYLWFWATTVSLCLCPFIYNPHQFAFTEFFVDYYRLMYWFWDSHISARAGPANDGHSWTKYTRESREKVTGVKKRSKVCESTRPAFRNAVLSKLGSSLLVTMAMGIPYIFMCSQKTSRHQTDPHNMSVFILSLEIAAASSSFSMICSAVIFVASILCNLLGSRKHANSLAMITHTLSTLGVIVSWWLIYIVCAQNFCVWILGIGFMCCIHHLWHTLLTVTIVRRQRDRFKTNDPWWRGNWSSANVGYKLPLVIVEEFIVKHMENIQYSYDFLTCHVILALQFPLILIPYIDKIHTLFLLWLKPSVTASSLRADSLKRNNRLVRLSYWFILIYVVNTAIIVGLSTFPLYAPHVLLDKVEDLLVNALG